MAGSLTAKTVAAAKHPHHGTPAKPIRLADGDGLYLQVTSGGAKSWLFRFMLAGRERVMGLGPVDGASLADARQAASAARALLRQGTDPIEHRVAARKAAAAATAKAAANTFRSVAEDYLAAHSAAWRNAKHRAQWGSTLATYAYPVMGSIPVAAVDTDAVLRAVSPFWTAKPETASRVRGRIEAVLDYAIARGLRDGVNPARWRGHMAKLLPSVKKVRRVRHHPALPWKAVGAFMAALRAREGTSARALEFAILTAARSGEVLGATWHEIDLAAGMWAIPAARMKAGREHRVPLSAPAMALLGVLRPLAADDAAHVFPGLKRGKGLSVMALDMTLRRMNNPVRWVDRHKDLITPHGFRSTFRDWAGEATPHLRETAEAALAHVVGGVEGAYARGDLLTKRKVLMDDWAAHCAKTIDVQQLNQ